MNGSHKEAVEGKKRGAKERMRTKAQGLSRPFSG